MPPLGIIAEIDQTHFFDPWIGAAYREKLDSIANGQLFSGQLHRFHLMAESHYSDEPVHPGLTIQAVEQLALEQNKWGAFWTKAIQVVERKNAWELDRRNAWNEVAFSNFIQETLAGPREAPDGAMWERGRGAFFSQLAVTKPTVLVVLGRRLFDQLPSSGIRVPWPLQMRLEWEPVKDAWLYAYRAEGRVHATLTVGVTHPSGRGFRWDGASKRAWNTMALYSNVVAAFEERTLTARNNAV